ncbi:transcription initiation factor TFIID subunit 4B [Pantherophis guttatus]|uniref:Transcription initiation factor TFIID subunit 4B n=1 Tax=Pantherophis guttatus TaxID=94885 RepID=A0A6P9D1I2_PANGU|nr:transcription initiation factor TFIID subunit 4B [Pantherophis guttatus]
MPAKKKKRVGGGGCVTVWLFACELGTLLLVLPHRQLRSFCSAPEHLCRLLCCGIAGTAPQALVLCPPVPFSSFMTTPPPVAAAAAVLGRLTAPGPPEHAALAADPPVSAASGKQEPRAVLPTQRTAPSPSCPAIPTGSPVRLVLNPAGARLPLSFVPSFAPQPRVLPAPIGLKVAPSTPGQQLPKSSNMGVRQAAPPSGGPKSAQMTIQLPANFQIPQGMILVRSNTGQLMLISQQALLQAQSQTSNNTSVRCSIPPTAPTIKIQPVQSSGTQVFKVLTAPVKTLSWATHSITSTVKKPAVIQCVTSPNIIGSTTKSLVAGSSAKPPVSDSPMLAFTSKPVADTDDPKVTQPFSYTEMLENVKKCKNFLATLIKLASSGPQAPQMGQNVKHLVQSLLEAKIEPEEFTKELYVELKSSPQPNLVPFLKKSLLALRQLMPNTETFIEQCLQQSAPQTASSTYPTASSTSSTVADGTLASSQLATSVPSSPLQMSSPQTSVSVPCATTTNDSVSLPLVEPACALAAGALSYQDDKSILSTQLIEGINTMKAMQPTSTTEETGTVSLPVAKPDCNPTLPSTVTTSSMKSAPSAGMTSFEVAKLALTTTATSATSVTTTVQPVLPITGTPTPVRVAHPNSSLPQPIWTSQAVKQLAVQQPSGSILRNVAKHQQVSTLPNVNKLCEKRPLDAFIQGSIVKQITLAGNKFLSLEASPVQRNKIRESGTTSFREEDDINDVASMAGVNLNEEHACILTTNSDAIGTVLCSCPDKLLLSSEALQKRILKKGKRHDIMEVNSDVLNLISHATQERLRGLLEKLTLIAQHRIRTYKGNDRYILSNDTRSQLQFLEQLDQVEKRRKDEEEKEELLRVAKSRCNKEDTEQLRLKQKAKEMQQLEFAQMQQREANRAALEALGPRKKRPLDSSISFSGLEGFNRTSSLTKPYLWSRITRICLRDLIFCLEQEKETKHSLILYQALLK